MTQLPAWLVLFLVSISPATALARRPPAHPPGERTNVFWASLAQNGDSVAVWVSGTPSEISEGDRMVLLDTAGVVGTGVIQGPSENNTWPFLLEGTPRVNPAAVVWAVTPTSLVSAQTRALTVNSDGQPRASAITGVDRNRLLAAIDRDGDGRADLVLLGWARNHTLSARHQLCRDVHSMVRVRARGAWRTVRHTRSNECRALGPPQERPMRDRPMESP